MISRSIMASRSSLLNTAEIQRLLLFFDHVLIWGLDTNQVSEEDSAWLKSEVEYLRSQKLVKLAGPLIPLAHKPNGNLQDAIELTNKVFDVVVPWPIAFGAPKNTTDESQADHVVRYISSRMHFENAPVLAHVEPSRISQAGMSPTAIEVVLKNVPLPPENIPWEDFIQFRAEEENIARLRSLRVWVQRQATSMENPKALQEELESLLYDYEKYMSLQHRKHGEGVVSTLVTAMPEAIAHLLSLNFGSSLKTILDVRAHGIALTEAEMSAPGREVSYISRVKNYAERR